ncbi:hypothetical protein [Heyndrickxia acidicola]|uniref:Uncharacterized protein n=1 Tax=Heyndrickxia acidicola TaxID=209389 RepID=A0ABU6MG32_9BACI|nr:hypothetical protein [Heyndrickxia acidicola]
MSACLFLKDKYEIFYFKKLRCVFFISVKDDEIHTPMSKALALFTVQLQRLSASEFLCLFPAISQHQLVPRCVFFISVKDDKIHTPMSKALALFTV